MALAVHFTLGSHWTFVGGKGGVGKTTVAAALAVELADSGVPVTILSTDPAHSLGDAFGTVLTGDPAPLPFLPSVHAFEVDAARERAAFLTRHGQAIRTIIERGTYLDEADVADLTDLPPPGLDELAALMRLADLAANPSSRVVVDTAPTGHTLRLLDLPGIALAWVSALEAIEEKHAAVAAALAGAAVPDEATHFLGSLRSDLERLESLFRDPDATRFVLVTTAEPVVLAETLRYEEELERRHVALGGVVVNRRTDVVPEESMGEGIVFVHELSGPLEGIDGLRLFAAAATPTPRAEEERAEEGRESPAPADAGELVIDGPLEPPLDRRIYLVGGKGGVGKTTVAASLALRLARRTERKILLLSVDPAGSLSEVLARPVETRVTIPPGFEPLRVQQLDARTAWEEFVDRYRADLSTVVEGAGAGAGTSLDRRVVDRLLDLAPPGMDELMALVEVVDGIEDGEYDALVLDTAPTGHFVRFLEMPEVALEWTHTLLRLLLKYREIVRLEGIGERVLALARTLRRLRELFTDPSSIWITVVALPESLSLPETTRLVPRLRTMGMAPEVLIINRVLGDGAAPSLVSGVEEAVRRLLRVDREITAVGTPALATGPTGPDLLASYLSEWRIIEEVAS